jgi:hypothetical protein
MPSDETRSWIHVVLTAFNLDFGIADRSQILDVTYLSHRLDLFERYCCPAIAAQTCRDFVWLVCFDQQTPVAIRDRLAQLAEAEPLLQLRFLPTVTDKKALWSDLVQAEIDAAALRPSHVITTNLDNDDGLHREFIERIQRAYSEPVFGPLTATSFEFINFPYGYMLRPDGLFLREFLASPFLSLIEPAAAPVTCKSIAHHALYDRALLGLPLRQIIAPPLWLQVVHGLNVVNNRDINSMPQPMERLLPGFAVDSTDRSSPSFGRWVYESLWRNEDGVPIGRRLRSLLMGLAPGLMGRYLTWQMERLLPPRMDAAAARAHCLAGESEFDGLRVDLGSKSLL